MENLSNKEFVEANIETFRRNVRELRIKKGFSQQEMGRRAGVAGVAVHLFENGGTKIPYPATLRKYAVALETSMEELFKKGE